MNDIIELFKAKGIDLIKTALYEQANLKLSSQTIKDLSFSDLILLKKIKLFFENNDLLGKVSFLSKLDDLKIEKLIIYIEGIDDFNKIKLLKKVYKAYLIDLISKVEFLEIYYIIKNSFLEDLIYIQELYNLKKIVSWEIAWDENEAQIKKNTLDSRIIKMTSLGVVIGKKGFSDTAYGLTPIGKTLFELNLIDNNSSNYF